MTASEHHGPAGAPSRSHEPRRGRPLPGDPLAPAGDPLPFADDPVLQQVLDRLREAAPQICDETCERTWRELDSYSDVSREHLEASVRRNLDIAIGALRSGTPPAAERLTGAMQTASERFTSNVPIEEIIRSFRFSLAVIHRTFIDACLELGASDKVTIGGSQVLWGVGDQFTTRLVTTYHSLEVDRSLRDAQQRLSVVRALLAGAVPPGGYARYSLAQQGRYAAIRSEPPPRTDPEAFRRHLERAGSTPRCRAFVALEGASCIGVVGCPPAGTSALVGIGTFVPLEQLAGSTKIAEASFQVARSLGRQGIQGVQELGWRLAAQDRREVTDLYRKRYIDPLEEEGTFGEEVLSTVKAYLDSDLNISRVAHLQQLHVNTVRYRLRRFEELTGATLTSTEVIMAVRWILDFH